jgi:hypothetical protein
MLYWPLWATDWKGSKSKAAVRKFQSEFQDGIQANRPLMSVHEATNPRSTGELQNRHQKKHAIHYQTDILCFSFSIAVDNLS